MITFLELIVVLFVLPSNFGGLGSFLSVWYEWFFPGLNGCEYNVADFLVYTVGRSMTNNIPVDPFPIWY